MSEIHVFTSAAYNYLPKVRMLFESIKKFHPNWVLHLALADEYRLSVDLSNEPFDEFCTIEELGIPEWRGWSYCHNIVELATAIKPFMMKRLLDRPGVEKVFYFDPDMVLFSALDDIVDALENSNIVLTPHQTTPEENIEAVIDNEICSLKHGIYNLGFIGVKAGDVGHAFLEWWSQRLYYFCRASIPNGLFTDQRWIDLVPAFFPDIAILRSSRHNVATWNITTRNLHLSPSGQYMVDGENLGFYHFTGFDSGAHRLMAAKNAGSNKDLEKLINWYENETSLFQGLPITRERWAFGYYSDGSKIQKEHRLIYRERVDLQRAFPNPYDSTTFLAWLNEQGRKEYPELFDSITAEKAFEKLSLVLTPGYQGNVLNNTKDNIKSIIGSMQNPRVAIGLLKRGWEVIKTEGFKGARHRLRF